MGMSIGWCAMVGRHKGVWQDHRVYESPQLKIVFGRAEDGREQYEREFRDFLDSLRWEDEGGRNDKA